MNQDIEKANEVYAIPVAGKVLLYRPLLHLAFVGNQAMADLTLDLVAESPEQVASVYRTQRSLGFDQGLLVANPVPKRHEIPRKTMEGYLSTALAELDRAGVTGKQVTPFLLSRVLELSAGRSLDSNIELLFNNVRLGCEIAKTLGGNP